MNPEDIRTIADRLVMSGRALHDQYTEIDKMYFMAPNLEKIGAAVRPQSDPDDVKLTISPSVRNAVIGLVRLLTTNEPRFKAASKTNEGKLSQIEDLCQAMWTASCAVKRADLHTDLVRSAALYSDSHLAANAVDDLLVTCGDEERARLVDIRKRTPYLFEVLTPPEDYPYFGRLGLRGMLREYEISGDELKATFRSKEAEAVRDSEVVTIRDWVDMHDRLVWINGRSSDPLFSSPHGLSELLISVQLADGSELWRKEEKRRQPFLYAMYQGNLWRRQNAVLTEIFTAINERGTGILLGFDEEPTDLHVEFAGPGIRYLSAKNPRMLSDAAFDPNLIGLIEKVLDPLTEASTIFPQTLGSSSSMGDAPFSSIALLSQSGQLPTVPVKKAVTNVIGTLMLAVLRRIKSNPPEGALKGIVDLLPSDIPDDLELEVSLEIKLPQDQFRNAQVAQVLSDKGYASKAWVQENLLQISDPAAMTKTIWQEKSAEMLYQKLLQDMLQPAPSGPAVSTETPPPVPGALGEPGAPAPGMGDPSMLGGVTSPGGPMAAAAGGGMLPASQPVGPAGSMPPGGPQ